MIHSYVPVVIAFVVAVGLSAVIFTLGSIIGPKRPNKVKSEPYECGIPSTGIIGERFSVKFFLVAVIFLLFDVEVVFLFPWASVFQKFLMGGHGLYILGTMAFFLFFLLLGLLYDWKKGGLKWE
jgi:NADH-quinone oxidoreductase subunit A